MNTVLAGWVVGGSLYAAVRLGAYFPDRAGRSLAVCTLFVAAYLTAFLVQGFVELAWRRPLISIGGAAVVTALIVVASQMMSRAKGVGEGLRNAPATSPIRRVPLALAIALLVVFALLAGLLLIAEPRGYEVRAYHLPIAVRVLRDGTLSLWDRVFMHTYPANISVWAALPLSLLPERWVAIVNLPFLALLCGAVYALGRLVGGDRSAAMLVATGTATVPIIGFSALEIGADVAGVAFLAVAAYLLLSRAGTLKARALTGGVAAGLAFGFKSLHLVPIVAIGFCFTIECVRQWRFNRHLGKRHALVFMAPVGWYAVGALSMTSFWLCRNWLQLGNPLYPVHITGLFDWLGWKAAPDFVIGGRRDNELEWVRSTREWIVYPWVEHHVVNQNFKHSSGLGAFFAATFPVLAVLWPIQALNAWRTVPTGRSKAREALLAGAVLYGIAVVIFAAWAILGDRQPRYIMGAIVLSLPLMASLITGVEGGLRTAHEVVLAIGAMTMALVLVVRLGVDNALFLLVSTTRAQRLEYPVAVDTLPPNAVIANAIDRPVDYALLGEGLRNHVVDAALVHIRLTDADGKVLLTRERIDALGLTHLYVESDKAIETGPCVRAHEIQRLERNPFNGNALNPARVLYALEIDCVSNDW